MTNIMLKTEYALHHKSQSFFIPAPLAVLFFFFGCPLGTFNFGYFFFVPWVVIFLDMRYRLFSALSLSFSFSLVSLSLSLSLG